MDEPAGRKQLVDVNVERVELELKEPESSKKRQKDSWDKFSSLSPMVSGILVALIGVYATTVYNARQQDAQNIQKDREISIQRIQTVEKFFSPPRVG